MPPSVWGVTKYKPADGRCTGQVLSEAFKDDPLARYLFGSSYEESAAQIFELFAWIADSSYDGTFLTFAGTDVPQSVAIWTPPADSAMGTLRTIWTVLRIYMLCGKTVGDRFSRVLKEFESDQQENEGANAETLLLMGTHPDMQSKGLGSELIRAGIERANSLGRPCYIEATTPRNVALYKRHGFRVLREYQCDNGQGPTLWLMFREQDALSNAVAE